MKPFILILMILSQSYYFVSQNLDFGKYYLLMNKVDYYLFTKPDYEKAVLIADSILPYEGITDNNLNVALVNYNLKRYTPAYHHLLKYAKSGNELISIVNTLEDGSIFKFRKEDLDFMLRKYSKLNNAYSTIQQKAKLKFNVSFNNDLIRLLYKDQSVRDLSYSISEGIDSACSKKVQYLLGTEFIRNDSLVFLEFKNTIKRNGLPVRNQVSNDAFLAFYFILMHGYTNSFSSSYCDSILKIARQRLTTDVFITPHQYAAIIDRYYINKKGENFYKELYTSSLPTFEPEKLNVRRREIFLPAIDLIK